VTDRIKNNFPFFQVPNNIFKQDLKTVELVVYLYLCRCGNNGGTAFPSYQNIADSCKIGKRTAIDAVKSLQEKKLLIKIVRPKDDGDNQTNIYEIVVPSKNAGDALASAGDALGGSAGDALASAGDAPNKELTYKEPLSYKEPLYIVPYSEIIDYLNEKAGTDYKFSGRETRKHIKARCNEGFRLDDFKKVIDIKVAEWQNDPHWSKFLRPQTLFGTKFEGYLNQQSTPKQSADEKLRRLEEL